MLKQIGPSSYLSELQNGSLTRAVRILVFQLPVTIQYSVQQAEC